MLSKRQISGYCVLLAIVCFTCALLPTVAKTENIQPRLEILWDKYGIPHIFGKDNESTFYGFGWAQMHSHGNEILRNFAEARGKQAEYFGEEFLEDDKYIKTVGLEKLVLDVKNAYKGRPNLGFGKAFVAGMNDDAIAQSFLNRI